MTESMSTTELVEALRDMATYDCGYEEQSDIAIAAASTIDRLTADLAEYHSFAAEYGIDGKTMLALAKSQIETARENVRLTERLGIAVELIGMIEQDIKTLSTYTAAWRIENWRGEESG